MEESINTNPFEEARRYVANAEEIIKKSKLDQETRLYRDKKYVRIAGDTFGKAVSSPSMRFLACERAKAARQ